MVIADPLLHHLFLLRAKADVPDLPTWLAYRQHQNGMAFATSALGTPRLMSNRALQEGSPQQFSRGEVGRQFVAPSFGVLMCHHVE